MFHKSPSFEPKQFARVVRIRIRDLLALANPLQDPYRLTAFRALENVSID
jgi:hypothetical protein